MDPARRARYRDKIDHARGRLDLAAAWRPAAHTEVKDRLAAYKAFQEAAEAAEDLVAMALVDSGRQPKDDHANLDAAAEAGVFRKESVDALHEAAGLRNRLVHEYNGLDDETALEAMEALIPPLRQFLEEVERWCGSKR